MFRSEDLTFISGGQSGADVAFLRAGKYLGVATAGYMPHGFTTEDGPKPEYQEEYGLQECFGGNRQRDILNVEQSDLLIAFLLNKEKTGRGTMSTINCARMGEHKHIQLEKDPEKQAQIEAERKAEAEEYQNKIREFAISGPTGLGAAQSLRKPTEAPTERDMDLKVTVFDTESDQHPVMVFWDISQPKLPFYQEALTSFLMKHQPKRIMISGPCRSTYPEIEELVVSLVVNTFSDLFKPTASLKGSTKHIGKVCHEKSIPKFNNHSWCDRCEVYHD